MHNGKFKKQDMYRNVSPNISKCGAVISTLLVLAFLLTTFIDNSFRLSNLLILVSGGSIVFLLIRVYILISRVKNLWSDWETHIIRGHILLHIVPLSYLILHLFIAVTFLINLLYAVPVFLFFFTGRLTWSILYAQFGSKMYYFFYKSNTALLIGPTVLLILGVLYKEMYVTNFYHRILLVYFIIHILLIGVAVVKIETDMGDEDTNQGKRL